MLWWLDDRLHRLKCRAYKAGRRRTFKVLRRLAMPICDRVTLMDHAR